MTLQTARSCSTGRISVKLNANSSARHTAWCFRIFGCEREPFGKISRWDAPAPGGGSQCAKGARAHRFIRRLPKGYDTVIGEGGAVLGEGQKQLLSIARVMLLDPAILVFDEATSSIDVRTELQVREAFAELLRGRTAFIVAHRLKTVQNADLILVMKDGQVIEQGTHAELHFQRTDSIFRFTKVSSTAPRKAEKAEKAEKVETGDGSFSGPVRCSKKSETAALHAKAEKDCAQKSHP